MSLEQKLADCRKKCESFGKKINELYHENKRLKLRIKELEKKCDKASTS